MSVPIISEPLEVYAANIWTFDIEFQDGEGETATPTDLSIYETITAFWVVKEFNPVNRMPITVERDEDANNILHFSMTSEQTAKMKSNGVFDVRGDGQAIIKGFTVWLAGGIS